MLGGEPIVTAAGDRLLDEKGRPSYVTSVGSGPSVGKAHTPCLPAGRVRSGKEPASGVEYLNETYPVTVAVVGATPLFDPENRRIRD